MKTILKKIISQSGASVSSTVSVVTGLALLVIGSILFYSYVMESWRVSSMIGELKKRSSSISETGSLEMKEFPENECQGYPVEALVETTSETVYLLRVKDVEGDTCRLLVEKYPADWFYLFVNNELDTDRTLHCAESGNMLDFVFMREREKTLPDCENVTCYNGGTCLRGVCACPNGVTGALCTRTNDCAGRDNGTRCTLAGREYDGVCLQGLCLNEGECPSLNWMEASLFCQGYGGLPEVLPVYNVSGQISDSNENGYWMAYLKNPHTRNAYQRTACFSDDAIVWTKERPESDTEHVWTVELHSGHVVYADVKQRHQVLCDNTFEEEKED